MLGHIRLKGATSGFIKSEEVSLFSDISHRCVVYVSTKSRPKQRSKDTIEANIGKIYEDLRLIQSFIETRKEFEKILFATPNALRNGQVIELKAKSRQFKDRIDYENRQKKKEKDSWKRKGSYSLNRYTVRIIY